MTDTVAESFSWRGTADKKCIRAFTVSTAIRRKNNQFLVKFLHSYLNYIAETFNENGGKEEDFVFASKSFFQYAKNRIKIKTAKLPKKEKMINYILCKVP